MKITKSIHEAALEEFQYQENIRKGIIIPSSTGRRYLDQRLLGGANDTDVIMIAAESGAGKSTEMLQIAYNLVTVNKKNRVLIFSFEMKARKLAAKLLAKKYHMSLKDMYDKDSGKSLEKEKYSDFEHLPIDVIEFVMNIGKIQEICDNYVAKYPDYRCHFMFDHSLLIENAKGGDSMETLEELAFMINKSKNNGSRVYWVINQLNDKIQDYKRLSIPSGQLPRKEDVYGRKSIVQACNNVIVLCSPKDMNLPTKTFGPKLLPFTRAIRNKSKPGVEIIVDLIYAVTVKARDGELGIDPLINNLKHSDLIEYSEVKRNEFREKYLT